MSRSVFYLKSFAVVVFAFMTSFFFCTAKTFAADPSGSKGNPVYISTNTQISEVTNLLKSSLTNRDKTVRIYVRKGNSSVDFDIVRETAKTNAFAYTTSSSDAPYGDYISYHTPLVKSKIGIDDNVYYIQYYMLYLDSAAEEAETSSNIVSILDSLSLSNKTNWQKVRAIRDYILNNMDLDYSYQNDSGGLAYSSSKANPYLVAILVYRFLKQRTFAVRVIHGYYVNSYGEQIRHTWNIVKIGSYWYNLDIALDMFINKYGGGFTAFEHEDVCFAHSEQNFQNHVRDPEYNTEEFNSTYSMSSNSYDPGPFKTPYGCDNHPYRTLGRF